MGQYSCHEIFPQQQPNQRGCEYPIDVEYDTWVCAHLGSHEDIASLLYCKAKVDT